MPNWASNELIVKGDNDKLTEFREAFTSFSAIVPLDGEWEYDKAVDTWGTKWDIDERNIFYTPGDEEDTYHFNTAWSPPEAFVGSASEKYPELEFILKTYDIGCYYANKLRVKNGKVIQAEYAETEEGIKEIDDELFKEMEV